MCARISEVTDRRRSRQQTEEIVGRLNSMLRGWSNYYRLGAVTSANETVLGHARRRLRRWLCEKHKVRRGQYARFSNEHLHGELGLVLLPGCTRGLSCATS